MGRGRWVGAGRAGQGGALGRPGGRRPGRPRGGRTPLLSLPRHPHPTPPLPRRARAARTRDARVGHVGVHAAAAGPPRPRAGAARDGLVVAHALVAECEVVHAALGVGGGGTGTGSGQVREDGGRHGRPRAGPGRRQLGARPVWAGSDAAAALRVPRAAPRAASSARTWDAAAAPKALSTTSVTRWLVSTLPPTTAASGLGLSRHCGGMTTLMGARQP
jgi:hypothetical protein